MRNVIIIALAGAALAAAPLAAGAQESSAERARQRAERAREREQERREREQERREREQERREANDGRYRYDPRDAEVRIDTTFAFTGGAAEITLVNGPIVVRTWDRREARVQAVVTRADLRTDFGPSRIEVAVEDGHRGGDQQVEITVPVGTRIRARNFSGDVTIAGVKAPVDARTISGDIEITDAAERVVVESVSGDVSASGVAGNARVTSVSGEIELSGVSGTVEGQSVSGDLTLRDVRSRDVRLEAVSGELRYAGTVERDGRYEFRSHSGDIEIRFPGQPQATFTAQTYSGTVESDVPMTVQPEGTANGAGRTRSSQKFQFTVGGGGARISTETFSGTIYLRTGTGPARD